MGSTKHSTDLQHTTMDKDVLIYVRQLKLTFDGALLGFGDEIGLVDGDLEG